MRTLRFDRNATGFFVVVFEDGSIESVAITGFLDTHTEIHRRLNDLFAQHNLDITLVDLAESEITRPYTDTGMSPNDYAVAHYYRLVLGPGIKALAFRRNEDLGAPAGVFPLAEFTRDEYLDLDLFVVTEDVVEKGLRNPLAIDCLEKVDGELAGVNKVISQEIANALDAMVLESPVALPMVNDVISSYLVPIGWAEAPIALEFPTQPGKVYAIYHTQTNSQFDFLANAHADEEWGSQVVIGQAPIRNSGAPPLPMAITDGPDILFQALQLAGPGFEPIPGVIHGGYPVDAPSTLVIAAGSWLKDQALIDFIDNLTDSDLIDGTTADPVTLTPLERQLLMARYISGLGELTYPRTSTFTYKALIREMNFDDVYPVEFVDLDFPGEFSLGLETDINIRDIPAIPLNDAQGRSLDGEAIYKFVVPEGNVAQIRYQSVAASGEWRLTLYREHYAGDIISDFFSDGPLADASPIIQEGTYYLSYAWLYGADLIGPGLIIDLMEGAP